MASGDCSCMHLPRSRLHVDVIVSLARRPWLWIARRLCVVWYLDGRGRKDVSECAGMRGVQRRAGGRLVLVTHRRQWAAEQTTVAASNGGTRPNEGETGGARRKGTSKSRREATRRERQQGREGPTRCVRIIPNLYGGNTGRSIANIRRFYVGSRRR